MSFNKGLGNLAQLSNAKTRSISPENFTGEKGKSCMATEGTGAKYARELGVGWKISPSVHIKPKKRFTMAEITGPGTITHMWMTCFPDKWRSAILKIYWDDEPHPSVDCPIGDFFCNGWNERANVNSLPITVNPAGGFNSYWLMPFRKKARIEIENIDDQDLILFYQIDYELDEVPQDAAYFHAKWNRVSRLPYKEVYTIIDQIKGKGHYVGTYLAWQVNNNNWWGEGEIKFYLDDDKDFPTISSTGTEDYFGGAWNFEQPKGEYGLFSTAYQGLHQVIKPDGLYRSQMRFGMYRFHIMDPIRFEKNLKVDIQALGWRSKERYLPLQDDIASVAYWYQTEPHQKFIEILNKDLYENI